MKRSLLAAGCAAAALLVAAPMAANAGSSTDRATGGGQVLIGSRGGAGDTIAFTARGTSDLARGQIQYVDRDTATQTVYHGVVECLSVDGNVATLAGVFTDGDGGGWQMIVTDNGQGAAAQNDIISFTKVSDPTCDEDQQDDDAEAQLARGNAQVYDAPDSE